MAWKWCWETSPAKLTTGWLQLGKVWYYFKANGAMATGWIKDSGQWYYLNQDGSMRIGWLQDTNKKWYYLGSNGAMYASCTKTINGKTYAFDASGSWIENACLVSAAGIEFIKRHEGFREHAYNDGAGTWTIGYGTVNKAAVALGTITQTQATQFLIEEVSEKAAAIKRNLNGKGVIVKQNEFDVLVDFAYNLGLGALFGSTFYARVCNGIRSTSLKDNLTAWSKAGGKTMPGLYTRRVNEFNLFMYGNYGS
jgi:lysozyme